MKQLLVLFAAFAFYLSAASGKNESKEAFPTGVEIKVTENDIRVIRTASEILSKPLDWNRNDNRKCPIKAKSFSLYCALYKASVDVNGEYDHRLAALEEVRRTVEEFSWAKTYEHRLMDYNNDPGTTFKDIQSVLKITLARLEPATNRSSKSDSETR